MKNNRYVKYEYIELSLIQIIVRKLKSWFR